MTTTKTTTTVIILPQKPENIEKDEEAGMNNFRIIKNVLI